MRGNTDESKLYEDCEVKDISRKLSDAFAEWGFVYLVDHGIETNHVFEASRNFFEKEDSFKQQFVRTSNESTAGYVPFRLETSDGIFHYGGQENAAVSL